MTARSIRRAAERKARKLARTAGKEQVGTDVSALNGTARESKRPDAAPISEAQLAANRANAQLSTGPTSGDGKAKSSLNAVKTGLTGRTVLLPGDDAAEYQRHIEAYEKEFQPIGQRERDLVQSIADTQWRLLRIPSLESGIYALGHLEFANEPDAASHLGMIEVKTFLKYERQLRNLQLQEARLQRRREKEICELRALQLERQRKEAEDLENSKQIRSVENGFVFSTATPCANQPRLEGRLEPERSLSSAL